MTGTKKRRIALYSRVSSDEQRENQTIRTQVDIQERWLEQHEDEVEVAAWLRDDGVTGTKPLADRPEGQKLLALWVPARWTRW